MSAVSPLDPGSGYQDAMFDLQELETSVAIAWDGNVAGRAGSVDPDTFAVEVMRAEMARLGLNPNVNRVLDGLARHVFGRGAIRDPLFVLAIDDFDLNPSRSFELIRLLRTVSTPRLFTIILGDLRVAEAVFALRVSKALAETAGSAANGPLLAVQADEVRTIASELAAHSLRKMIPPAQTVHITTMNVPESLAYRPITDDRAPAPPLRDVMSLCPLDVRAGGASQRRHREVKSLYDLLLASACVGDQKRVSRGPKHSGKAGADAARDSADNASSDDALRDQMHAAARNATYTAIDFLKTTPRRVADMWFSLHNVSNREVRLEDVLAELFQKAVSEDGTLAYADRQTLLRAVSLDTSGKWKLNSLAYEEEPRVGPGVTLAAAEDRPEQYDEGRPVFQFSPGEGWSLWPKGKRVSPAGEEEVHSVAPAVEVATASALMLVQDVLIFNPHGSWNSRPLLQGHPLRKRWAMTEWRVDYWQRPVITWPTPIWSTFWEYDLFLGHWNATLAEYSSRTANNDAERRLDYLVFTWMDAATAVLLGEEPIGTRRQGSSLSMPWGELVERLGNLAGSQGQGNPGEDQRDGWLLDVGFMLLPEVTGLSWRRPKEFMFSQPLRGYWKTRKREIVNYRRRVLEHRFVNAGTVRLASYLGDKIPLALPDGLSFGAESGAGKDGVVRYSMYPTPRNPNWENSAADRPRVRRRPKKTSNSTSPPEDKGPE